MVQYLNALCYRNHSVVLRGSFHDCLMGAGAREFCRQADGTYDSAGLIELAFDIVAGYYALL